MLAYLLEGIRSEAALSSSDSHARPHGVALYWHLIRDALAAHRAFGLGVSLVGSLVGGSGPSGSRPSLLSVGSLLLKSGCVR